MAGRNKSHKSLQILQAKLTLLAFRMTIIISIILTNNGNTYVDEFTMSDSLNLAFPFPLQYTVCLAPRETWNISLTCCALAFLH